MYYSELKRKALLAKQRMRMGYWQQVLNKREDMLNKVGNNDSNIELVSQFQRAEIKRETGVIINNPMQNHDESLYKKVKKILDEDEFVSNPIGKLIDRDQFENLDEGARGLYILNLSKKYNELRERYYKERAAENLIR